MLHFRPAPTEARRRALLAEARALASLAPHPGVAVVREDFFWEDDHVLVSDFVPGVDLQRLLGEQGDPGFVETGRTLAGQAATRAAELGMHGLAARAADLVDRAGRP
ncbi:MAG: hypothetical protein ACYDAD_03855 [Acidimicrobiales bacterium]